MINVLLTGIVAFTITFVAIPAIMRVAVQKKLFDIPDDRKLHTKPIASLGGVALFLGLFISTLLSIIWGVLDGEQVTAIQVACLGLILSGVYIANR